MSVSRFSPGEITWSNLPERWRAQLINSASGFKPLVLLATHNSQNIDNLAVFSQLIHLGANPPLLGVLFRPDSVPRHTLENLQTQGKIHKSNQNKSFLLCNENDHEHVHNPVLVICNDCGKTEELEVNSFSKLLANLKTKAQFQFQNFQMEVSSTCKSCN